MHVDPERPFGLGLGAAAEDHQAKPAGGKEAATSQATARLPQHACLMGTVSSLIFTHVAGSAARRPRLQAGGNGIASSTAAGALERFSSARASPGARRTESQGPSTASPSSVTIVTSPESTT